MTSRFAGRESEVRNAVGDYLRWLREDAHKRAEGFKDDLKSAEVEIKRRLSPKQHNRARDPLQPAVEEMHQSTSEPVEGDWASDDSDTRASRPTNTKSLHGKATFPFKHKESAKKRKHVRPSTVETPNISREHSRVRGDRSSTPSPHRHGPRGTGIPVLRTTSWDVGSLYYHPRPTSAQTDSRRGSIRNLRIDSLRTAGMPGSPRELSPARSVRFADSHPPRLPLPMQDTSVATTSQSRPGEGDEDSPRTGKVAFELPSDKH